MQERLTFVSHYRNLEQLKNNPKYEYIQPPVGHFSSAKFDSFEVTFKPVCFGSVLVLYASVSRIKSEDRYGLESSSLFYLASNFYYFLL